MKWLLIVRSENVPINGPMSNEKAQEFAEQLNLEDLGEFRESMSKSLKELNRSLDRVELSYKKQSVITSFFSKQ